MNKTGIRDEYEKRFNEMYNQVSHYKERWMISSDLYDIELKRNIKLSEKIKQLEEKIKQLE